MNRTSANGDYRDDVVGICVSQFSLRIDAPASSLPLVSHLVDHDCAVLLLAPNGAGVSGVR